MPSEKNYCTLHVFFLIAVYMITGCGESQPQQGSLRPPLGGTTIVWKDASALQAGEALIAIETAQRTPDVLRQCIACVAIFGRTVQIIPPASLWDRLQAMVYQDENSMIEILVLRGDEAGCRGVVRRVNFQREH